MPFCFPPPRVFIRFVLFYAYRTYGCYAIIIYVNTRTDRKYTPDGQNSNRVYGSEKQTRGSNALCEGCRRPTHGRGESLSCDVNRGVITVFLPYLPKIHESIFPFAARTTRSIHVFFRETQSVRWFVVTMAVAASRG